MCAQNFITETEPAEKTQRVQSALSRLRVIKVFDLEELFIILSMIVQQVKTRSLSVDLRLVIIDSLSSLFAASSIKRDAFYQSVKDLLFYLKTLAKNHFVGVVYTNNTRDAGV